MKKWIGTIANFFLPGLGYLIIGGERRLLGIPWLIGVLGLTYVELSIQEPLPQLYWIMFDSVLVMNVSFAVDAWREAKKLEG